MTTRYSKYGNNGNSINFGYEGNVTKDYNIPSCNLEDVDRSLFDFFDKQAVFQYSLQNELKKIPVVFATGERFAVLRRKKPLRDKHGALVLPLISMMRTGVSQTHAMGAGYSELLPLVVKQKISEFDEHYQRVQNNANSINVMDALSSNSSRVGALGAIFNNNKTKKNKNSYEFITIPPVKFFTVTYDVTFWTQYTQQMTEMMTALMATYQNNQHRMVRLETNKGYWFVAQFGEQLSSGDNFDSLTDEERIIKYNFEVTIPAYLILSEVDGIGSAMRSFTSSPSISFEINDPEEEQFKQGIQSGKPADYIKENIRTLDEPLPGQQVAGNFPSQVDTRDYNGLLNNKNFNQKTINKNIQGEQVLNKIFWQI